jgi:hypothetical protein
VRVEHAPRHAPPAFSLESGSTCEGGSPPFDPPDAASGNGNPAGFRTFRPARDGHIRVMGLVPMTANDNPKPDAARRSGSQRRVRARKIPVACDEAEFLQIDERARAVGLSRPSFLRACALGTPGPRAQRTPPINAEALARATAALGKVGSNLNQAVHVLNASGAIGLAQEFRSTLVVIREAAAAIREIVGRKDRA